MDEAKDHSREVSPRHRAAALEPDCGDGVPCGPCRKGLPELNVKRQPARHLTLRAQPKLERQALRRGTPEPAQPI